MDIVVAATPDSLGYTRHLCINCNYSYLTDFVTSGDDGYIVPEEPAPEIHQHAFNWYVEDDAEAMNILVLRACVCGETYNGYYTVYFTDEDGNISEIKQTGNRIDYSEMYGFLEVRITDEDGADRWILSVQANEKPTEPTEPIEPSEPIEPTEPVEPTTPDEPSNPETPDNPNNPETPNEQDKPDEPKTDNEPNKPDDGSNTDNPEPEKKNGTAIALMVIFIVVVVGGIVGLIVYKKIKSKKNGGK